MNFNKKNSLSSIEDKYLEDNEKLIFDVCVCYDTLIEYYQVSQ